MLPGLIDERVIDQVKQATDIVSVVGQYVPLKRSGKSYIACCPFHREKTPSFNVSPERQIFKCFGCGEGGNVFGFLMRQESLSFPEAVRLLADRAGIAIQEKEGESRRVGTDRRRVREVNLWAARLFRKWFESPDGADARAYLDHRGISEQTARRFGLGWAPDEWDALLVAAREEKIDESELLAAGLVLERDSGGGCYDRFRGRLIFPIISPQGDVIAFGGRALGDSTPKYLNSPETAVFSKGRCMYGLNAAKAAIREERRALVVEGYTDCLALHQEGVRHVAATLGTALTVDHLRLLRRYADEVTLIFDGDEAGQKAADRALELFVQEDVEVRVAHLPRGQDPCDFVFAQGADAFVALLDRAVGALDFRLGRALGGATGVTGKRRAMEDVLRIIAQCDDEVKRTLLVQRAAEAANLPEDVLRRDVNRQRRRGPRATRDDAYPVELDANMPGREREILQALFADETLAAEFLDRIPSSEEFRHPGVRRLCEGVVAYVKRHGRFVCADFLSGVSDPTLSKLAVGLLKDKGADKEADFQPRATLVSSLASFESERQARQSEQTREALDDAGDADERRRLLAELARQVGERRAARGKTLADGAVRPK